MRLAFAYIASHRYCRQCGYVMTGLVAEDVVTCPECGELMGIDDLPAQPPPGSVARWALKLAATGGLVAKIAVGLGSVLLVVGVFTPMSGRHCGGPLNTPVKLHVLSNALRIYGDSNGGVYPAHAASLIPLGFFDPEMVVNIQADEASTDYTVGGYDLLSYDWSSESTAALNQAIRSVDLSAPYYALGDFWFVRLAKPTDAAAIIVGWSVPDDDGDRWVSFDDGSVTGMTMRWRERSMDWLRWDRRRKEAHRFLCYLPTSTPSATNSCGIGRPRNAAIALSTAIRVIHARSSSVALAQCGWINALSSSRSPS